MRKKYLEQIATLHNELIIMGSMCEEAIGLAAKGLIENNEEIRKKVIVMENDIDLKEREIEDICLQLILREQPVACDLRRITAAQKMITDMERIGDQAADIADLTKFINGKVIVQEIHILDMAKAVIKMLNDAIDAFVEEDLEKARAVILYDDVVDELFSLVRTELNQHISNDPSLGDNCLDLLMIAKYLERIGDHATNIAESVEFSILGPRRVET